MALAQEPTDAVGVLVRWVSFGGKWRILEQGPSGLTLSLRRCDSDEEVDRITSADSRLLAYIGDRPASD